MLKKNQKICDRLCTPIVKKLHERCLLCGGEIEVAHHYVHKSMSLALRYDPQNLVPLCGRCHCKLHCDESYWGGMIRDKMGDEWFKYLESKKYITTRYMDYNKVWEDLMKILNA